MKEEGDPLQGSAMLVQSNQTGSHVFTVQVGATGHVSNHPLTGTDTEGRGGADTCLFFSSSSLVLISSVLLKTFC